MPGESPEPNSCKGGQRRTRRQSNIGLHDWQRAASISRGPCRGPRPRLEPLCVVTPHQINQHCFFDTWLALIAPEHLEHIRNGAVPMGDPSKSNLNLEITVSVPLEHLEHQEHINLSLQKKFLVELTGRPFGGSPDLVFLVFQPFRNVCELLSSFKCACAQQCRRALHVSFAAFPHQYRTPHCCRRPRPSAQCGQPAGNRSPGRRRL